MMCLCGSPAFARGMCSKCYGISYRARGRKKGSPSTPQSPGPREIAERLRVAKVDLEKAKHCYLLAVGMKARLRWGAKIRELEAACLSNLNA